jgi:predicted outer membrane protein
MKTAMSLAAACGLLTTLAFAQSAPPPAQEFVTKVAISDMFEIQSSQLALSKQADVRYQAVRRENGDGPPKDFERTQVHDR